MPRSFCDSLTGADEESCLMGYDVASLRDQSPGDMLLAERHGITYQQIWMLHFNPTRRSTAQHLLNQWRRGLAAAMDAHGARQFTHKQLLFNRRREWATVRDTSPANWPVTLSWLAQGLTGTATGHSRRSCTILLEWRYSTLKSTYSTHINCPPVQRL
jgi:hypothetical protein